MAIKGVRSSKRNKKRDKQQQNVNLEVMTAMNDKLERIVQEEEEEHVQMKNPSSEKGDQIENVDEYTGTF